MTKQFLHKVHKDAREHHGDGAGVVCDPCDERSHRDLRKLLMGETFNMDKNVLPEA